MSEPKHTPLPWLRAATTPHYTHAPYMIWGPLGPGYGTVAQTCSSGLMPSDPVRQAADAEFITLACNSHYDLLAALESLVGWCEATDADGSTYVFDAVIEAKAAIAKARGGDR